MRDVSVILNARAGSLLGRDHAEIRKHVADALAGEGRRVTVALASGRSITDAIGRAAAGSHDTLIVGGGDGSVSYAASRLAGGDKVLGVLPLGTMNLLGRDLGMPAELPAMLDALSRAKPHRIDLAMLNGRVFHSLSGIGFFSQMARAREEARNLPGRLLQVGTAALRAFTRIGRFTLTVDVNGKRRPLDTFALLVTCNRFGGKDWRRDALDGGALEVHIARDEGALARLKAGADLISGGWRDNPGIESYVADKVVIGAARRRVSVATDGELRRETIPLRYEIKPRALTVLMPA